MPAKRSTTGYRLVPEAIRKQFTALTVHFDFLVRKERLEEFRNAWKQAAPRSRERWGPFSDKADEALGLTILSPRQTEAGEVYHAIVEFRRGSSSPYTKISSRRMLQLTERLRKVAEKVVVESLRQTLEIEKEAFLKDDTSVARIFESAARETADGYRARVTGFKLSLDKPEKPPIWVDFDWGGKAVRVTTSTKGLRFATLDELFDTEMVKIGLPSLKSADPQEDEVPNAH
jgi:hypothetical protein